MSKKKSRKFEKRMDKLVSHIYSNNFASNRMFATQLQEILKILKLIESGMKMQVPPSVNDLQMDLPSEHMLNSNPVIKSKPKYKIDGEWDDSDNRFNNLWNADDAIERLQSIGKNGWDLRKALMLNPVFAEHHPDGALLTGYFTGNETVYLKELVVNTTPYRIIPRPEEEFCDRVYDNFTIKAESEDELSIILDSSYADLSCRRHQNRIKMTGGFDDKWFWSDTLDIPEDDMWSADDYYWHNFKVTVLTPIINILFGDDTINVNFADFAVDAPVHGFSHYIQFDVDTDSNPNNPIFVESGEMAGVEEWLKDIIPVKITGIHLSLEIEEPSDGWIKTIDTRVESGKDEVVDELS